MPFRRHCDPLNIRRIWDAIRSLNFAHQTPDLVRIVKYFQKFNTYTQAQVEHLLQQATKDQLIVSVKKGTSEPASVVYKVATSDLPEFDGKDWYCFECHLAGDVIACKNCFRVYHGNCIKTAKVKYDAHKPNLSLNTSDHSFDGNQSDNFLDPEVYDENICSVCNLNKIEKQQLLKKPDLNYLLKFVLHRVRGWLPNAIIHQITQNETADETGRPVWLTDSELTWRANHLFFEHRDISVIEVNLNTEFYQTLTGFLADILTLQHNVAIFHGVESEEYQASEYVVRDTIHDITEIKNCADCYKHSNEKINARWFALPCEKPHQLVWAKQKGYSYWPAKVIKDMPSHCDVRFFGGKHERSVINKTFIKPIKTSYEELKIKQNSTFRKAYDELQYHQRLLIDPNELANIKAMSKAKKVPKSSLLLSATKTTKATTANHRQPSKQFETFPVPEDNHVIDVDASPSNSKRKQSLEDTLPIENNNKKFRGNIIETSPNASVAVSGNNVIDISNCDDDDEDDDADDNENGANFSFRGNNGILNDPYRFDSSSFEQVTSSTEENLNRDSDMQQLDQPYSDSVEKMRRKLEGLSNKNDIVRCAMDCMQIEIDKIVNDHNDHLKRLFESHNAQISETKKKQWCYNCEQDAIYHCCWNTAYCSQSCQQQHWQEEHKKVCRRKR